MSNKKGLKPINIIALVAIAVGIAVAFTAFGSAGEYTKLSQALVNAEKGVKAEYHVTAKLKRDASGQVVGIVSDIQNNPDRIKFTVVDDEGKEYLVDSKVPASMSDFKKSERIVLVGKFEGEIFKCSKITLKCPSKYEEGKKK